MPEGWALLPRGDAFLTRVVKQGPHWLAWEPRTRSRGHRRAIGVWAPADAIEEAKARAAATEDARAAQRVTSARQRERRYEREREELRAAVIAFLDFTPDHEELAVRIADEASERAAQVGSGRVGRTSKLTVAEKAELAARAHIRHHHTTYHDLLDDVDSPFDDRVDDAAYRAIKRAAHAEVDAFLAAHRPGEHSGRASGGSWGSPGTRSSRFGARAT